MIIGTIGAIGVLLIIITKAVVGLLPTRSRKENQ